MLSGLVLRFLRSSRPGLNFESRIGSLHGQPLGDVFEKMTLVHRDIKRYREESVMALIIVASLVGLFLSSFAGLAFAIVGFWFGIYASVLSLVTFSLIVFIEKRRMDNAGEDINYEMAAMAFKIIGNGFDTMAEQARLILKQSRFVHKFYYGEWVGEDESGGAAVAQGLRNFAVAAGMYMVATGNDAGFRLMGLVGSFWNESKGLGAWVESRLARIVFPVGRTGKCSKVFNKLLACIPLRFRMWIAGRNSDGQKDRAAWVVAGVGAVLIAAWFKYGSKAAKPYIKPRNTPDVPHNPEGYVDGVRAGLGYERRCVVSAPVVASIMELCDEAEAGAARASLRSQKDPGCPTEKEGDHEAKKGRNKGDHKSAARKILTTKDGNKIWEYEDDAGHAYWQYNFEGQNYIFTDTKSLVMRMHAEDDGLEIADYETLYGFEGADGPSESSKATVHLRKENRRHAREQGDHPSTQVPSKSLKGTGGNPVEIQFGSLDTSEIQPAVTADPEACTQGVITTEGKRVTFEGKTESALGGCNFDTDRWMGGVLYRKDDPAQRCVGTFMSGSVVFPTHCMLTNETASLWSLKHDDRDFPITKVVPVEGEDRLSLMMVPQGVASTKIPRGDCIDNDSGVLVRYDSIEGARIDRKSISAGDFFKAPKPGALGRHKCSSAAGDCGGALISLRSPGGRVVGIHSNGDDGSSTNGYIPLTEAVAKQIRDMKWGKPKN